MLRICVSSTDCSKLVHLFQFLFVCASLASYVAFVLSLFVSHLLSMLWILWDFLSIFTYYIQSSEI